MRVRVRTLLPPLLCLIRAHTHAPRCPEPLDDRPLPGPPAAPETARPARQPAPAHHLAGRRGVGPPGGEPGPGLRQAVRPAGGVNPAGMCACPLLCFCKQRVRHVEGSHCAPIERQGQRTLRAGVHGRERKGLDQVSEGWAGAHAHGQARAVPGDDRLHAHWLHKE